jgi:CBS-domain-containing membrane protein
VRRLPVIDRQRLVGILGQAGLAKALPDEKAGDLVQAISQD